MCALRLENVRPDEQLALCRKYFYIGCFCLPFVWLINAIWFFETAFKKEPFDQQPSIRKYVTCSIVGAVIWGVLLIGWNVCFHCFRTEYAQYLDYLSFTFPVGYV